MFKSLFVVLLWPIFFVLTLSSCEDYGKDEQNDRGVIRAGEALQISNVALSEVSLTRLTRMCEGLEEYHDNILRGVFSEDFIFSRRQKVYGDPTIRDISNIGVYIEVPNDYNTTPTFKGTKGVVKNFITKIPTENNLYMASLCDYTLNNVGAPPKVQQLVGSQYYVYNVISDDRFDVGIYTKHNDSKYYLYRSYQYRFDINKDSRYYGMAIEQSEIFISDHSGKDYRLIYQKFLRAD
ncbi:hypothetical protein ABMA70_01880 [Halobacteriovorax sp. XZX-3]|uniref:hypothetical protein n=1 Tax=unclassified Halobacteriovorax TaxID=2639665 RepID=UPI000CD09E65|nr:hypothetical protein [Halobacteriovorax sp. DA5]POB14495.1 hypothetical protein C0Z22_05225 [Halobacteriovorax sp. DA5]